MNDTEIEKIKRLTIGALVSDDLLMGILVLKGGNALNIAYDISNRGSVDIDFSMESDFSEAEKKRLRNQFEYILNHEFSKENYKVFDVKFSDRPEVMDDSVKEFWGGYLLEFKLMDIDKYELFNGDIESVRRNALNVGKNGSTKFTVDISKYEFVANKKPVDIEGSVVYVYTPEMIALEKLRAICQQLEEYKEIVKRMRSSPRARDFFDIHNLCSHFSIDFTLGENVKLAEIIFESKKVPLEFINRIKDQYELHKENWESVIQTVNQEDDGLRDFDFYFNFVIDTFSHLGK